VWSAIAAGGGAVGLLLGGVLTDLASWPWIFIVNVPVGVITLLLTIRFVRESRDGLPHRSYDLAGAVSVTAGLVVLVYAIVKAQAFGWGSGRTLGLIAAVLALLAVFVVIERRAVAPLIWLSIFRIRTLAVADGVLLLVASGMFAMFFFALLLAFRVITWRLPPPRRCSRPARSSSWWRCASATSNVVVDQMSDAAMRGRELLESPEPGEALFEFLDEMAGRQQQARALFEAVQETFLANREIRAAHREIVEVLDAPLGRAQEIGAVRHDVKGLDLLLLLKGVCETAAAFQQIDPQISERHLDLCGRRWPRPRRLACCAAAAPRSAISNARSPPTPRRLSASGANSLPTPRRWLVAGSGFRSGSEANAAGAASKGRPVAGLALGRSQNDSAYGPDERLSQRPPTATWRTRPRLAGTWRRCNRDRLVAVLGDNRPCQRGHDPNDDGATEDDVEDDCEGHICSFSGSEKDQTGVEDGRRIGLSRT
jgi:hypothetical protein